MALFGLGMVVGAVSTFVIYMANDLIEIKFKK